MPIVHFYLSEITRVVLNGLSLRFKPKSRVEVLCIPVPGFFFISDLKDFISNLISGQKFFLKFSNKAGIF